MIKIKKALKSGTEFRKKNRRESHACYLLYFSLFASENGYSTYRAFEIISYLSTNPQTLESKE